jgi:5'-methylthioadenosine phosphorylase
MVTDYDCWREGEAVDTAEIIAQLGANAEKARALVQHLVAALPKERPASPIDTCLDTALLTAPAMRDPALVSRLDAVAGRALRRT